MRDEDKMTIYLYYHGVNPVGSCDGELIYDREDIEKLNAMLPNVPEVRRWNSNAKRDIANFKRGLLPVGKDLNGYFIWSRNTQPMLAN